MRTHDHFSLGLPIMLVAIVIGAQVSAAASAGDVARGKQVFQERCGLCHAAAPDDGDGGQGPALAGVVGRKAASVAGFHYTQALRASERVWTPAALDAFLAAPAKDVPGTNMPVSTPLAADRADLIAYLATVK